VGTVIENISSPILIVAPEGREEETVMRLSRVGYDNCIGYLEGGFDSWKNSGKPVSSITSISADEFSKRIVNSKLTVIDVRKPGEYEAQHIADVPNFPLDFIDQWKSDLDQSKEYYIHCAGGYRSMIAASILSARGFERLIDIEGGFSAIQKTAIPVTCFSCTSAKA
jgi:rhodanese-related sulfurtransferase